MVRAGVYPDWGLVLIRISCGLILSLQSWNAFRSGIDAELVEGAATTIAAAPPAYAWFAENVFLRAPTVFAHVLVWGGLLCGAALTLGVLTRPAGCLAGLGLANLCLAGPPEQRPFALLMAICCFACSLSRAGRTFGGDATLDPMLPAWATWVSRKRDMFR